LLFFIFLYLWSPKKHNQPTLIKLIMKNSIASYKLLSFVIVALLMLSSAPAWSYFQEEEDTVKVFRFADEQLLGFFDANQDLSALQRETQEKIATTVADHGLTMERFNQIANAARIGALQGGTFSPEEIEAFNTVAPQVTDIQRNMQQMFPMILQEYGLTTDLYQEILTEFRQDRDMQAYVSDLARERAIEAIREERRREREREQQEGDGQE
jgi:hypothetical protein